ncbi:hypothetical protein DPMN_002897 [Dreissena polymorpha]|uniref:Uncharacterized protein n=1 Tax=Dreissena polymorpha TaxID=45954 RepID=A0A9D4MNZ8_DREPO|nr:hypothetical protein DPMN_002897 [Dreissena polymorpha]
MEYCRDLQLYMFTPDMGYVETFNCTCSHQTWGMKRPSIVHVHTRHGVCRDLRLYMFTPDMGYEETFNCTCSHQTWGM